MRKLMMPVQGDFIARITSYNVCYTKLLRAYDPSLYDLVLPVEGRDHRELTEEILKFYHKTSILRTAESQQAVQNLKTRAEVELVLLAKGHNLPVAVDGDKVTIIRNNFV